MHRCLKDGWITLSELALKLGKSKHTLSRSLRDLDDDYKEYVGKTLVVFEKEAYKILPNLSYSVIREIIENE